MISIKSLINLLVLLTLAQFYNYFSIFRIHLFLVFILVVLGGILLGFYLSFRSTEFITPELNPKWSSEEEMGYLEQIVTYKAYTDSAYLSGNHNSSIVPFIKIIRAESRDELREKSAEYCLSSPKIIRFNRSLDDLDKADYSSIDARSLLSDDCYYDRQRCGIIAEDEDELEMDSSSMQIVDDDESSESNSKFESYLNELIEYFVRDYILSWLSKFIWDKEKFNILAKSELKQLLKSIRKHFRKLDYVKLISKDIILRFNQHFLNVKNCSNLNETFKLNYYEMDVEKEREHLRNLVEIFMLSTFTDKNYFKTNVVRHLIRELIVNNVLLPTINSMCDPDYLNQKISAYLTTRENLRANLNNRFSHAATYEDFIRLIKCSNNIDELKQLHFKIMNEIMQATIINDFKYAKLADQQQQQRQEKQSEVITCGSSSFFASFSTPKVDEVIGGGGSSSDSAAFAQNFKHLSGEKSGGTSTTKAEVLRSRNLKIYIKQLRYAKLLCERRLNRLNSAAAGPSLKNSMTKINSSTFYDEETCDLSFENKLKNRKILPIESVLSSSKGLSIFLKYLEHDGSDRLLRFWIDVEKLKKINMKKKYELANKIYEIYLNTYDSPVRDEVGKDLNKSMQLFLIGNNTDDGFYKAQEKILKVLEMDHYPSFIVTDLYDKALEQIESEAKNNSIIPNLPNSPTLTAKINTERQKSLDVNRNQVEILVEKLGMKISALNAIKSNGYQQVDSKIVEVLEKDIKQLKHDISVYESHIQKTELWCDNIGKWKTKVVGARTNQTNGSSQTQLNLSNGLLTENGNLLFEIQVELYEEDSKEKNLESSKFREGWVIYRSYKQFENLNESLNELIPSELKSKFKKIPGLLKKIHQEMKIKQITAILDEYLRVISQDESLTQSEALYTFLCPSPDYFKRSNSQNLPTAASSDEKFSLTSIFKILKQKDLNDDDYLDQLFSESYLKNIDNNTARDSIAEPFYYLFEELFEIKGVKKILRKSFIVFVQITYGATINRIIREKVTSVLSDDYMSYFVKQLKDTFWQFDEETGDHNLIQTSPALERTNEEKLKTKKLAKLKLIANIPEILTRLVGDKNSQIGVIKLFEMFQDQKLNKHLVYSMIEMLMGELFPEKK